MTVGEMITRLNQFPLEAEVVVYDREFGEYNNVDDITPHGDKVEVETE